MKVRVDRVVIVRAQTGFILEAVDKQPIFVDSLGKAVEKIRELFGEHDFVEVVNAEKGEITNGNNSSKDPPENSGGADRLRE